MLRHTNPGLLDDAALWSQDDGTSLVSTVDFFTPIVDDARTWGAIAAANAASDVYAMGGTPMFGLNVVAWPRDDLPLDLLAEVLAGGADCARRGGWSVVGGHTVDAPEPMYGMAMTGRVTTDAALRLSGAQVGDALVLTKPLGTGVLATAVKRTSPDDLSGGGALASCYSAGVVEMTRLNDVAATVALSTGATACTDVTGFGLLGHLREMLVASKVGAVIDACAVPMLSGVVELFVSGYVAGGSERNADAVRSVCAVPAGDDITFGLLADAQTSGGLLFACEPQAAHRAAHQLLDSGHRAAVIGEVRAASEGDAPLITVTGSIERE